MKAGPIVRHGLRGRVWALVLSAGLIAACSGDIELLSEIAEAEANDVLAALASEHLTAQKVPGKEGMVKLLISRDQVARAVNVLNAEGLPRQRYATMGDVFRKEGLISSPLEERARYLWALSQELSATIAQVDGVLKARVHVVLPERISGGGPSMPSSAAVFIKHHPGYSLQGSIAQIKQLVSNSIPGLAADKVTVVLLPAQAREGHATAPAATASAPAASAPAASAPAASAPAAPGATLLSPRVLRAGAAASLLFVVLAGAGWAGWWMWSRRRRAAEPGQMPEAGVVNAA
jgi:type III secretion protein J